MSDFKDHPVSLTEIRAKKSSKACDWTPRDAVIDLLRRIDEGEPIDAVVIVSRERLDDGNYRTLYNNCAPDLNSSLGMLARAAFMMQERG